MKIYNYGGLNLGIGMLIKVDKLGRIVIPKEYREFYHMDKNDNVCLIETTEGLLITNPKYKVVEVTWDENDKKCFHSDEKREKQVK